MSTVTVFRTTTPVSEEVKKVQVETCKQTNERERRQREKKEPVRKQSKLP